MKKLVTLAKRVTNKKVESGYDGWTQDVDTIHIPEGDEEGLLHEVLHWIVASDEERRWLNLALDEDDVYAANKRLAKGEKLKGWTINTPTRRERQVCYLTRKVYALRGWEPPKSSSCKIYDPATRTDREWADARLALSSTTLEKLAGALETGVCKFGYSSSLPGKLPGR